MRKEEKRERGRREERERTVATCTYVLLKCPCPTQPLSANSTKITTRTPSHLIINKPTTVLIPLLLPTKSLTMSLAGSVSVLGQKRDIPLHSAL